MNGRTTSTVQRAEQRRWGTGSWSAMLVAGGFTLGAVSFNGFTLAEYLTRHNVIPTGFVSMAGLLLAICGWALGRKYRHVHRGAALGQGLGTALAALFALLLVMVLIAT